MTDVKTNVSGFFPRPPYLREKLKSIGGLQKESMKEETKKEIIDYVNRARNEVIKLQNKANLDYCSEGQLLWDDLLAYPATKINGFKMNGLIRYYNTNRFYRTPIIKNKLKLDNDFIIEDTKKAQNISNLPITTLLPGPFTLLDLSENKYYDKSYDAINDIKKILINKITSLEDLGIETIQIDDPSITKNFDGIKRVHRDLKDKTDLTLIINTYFGDATPIFDELNDIVDGIGLDLVNFESNWEILKNKKTPRVLKLGLFDSKNTRVERKKKVVREVENILEFIDSEEIIISTNLNLDFLPWPVMEKKIETIGLVGEEF
ncbi:hypothetical protein C9439_06875 [archaeon SCG-AAA382B04]|nr:hypothetical protein C9439_06875 [archaeon SCG-AAA382B04]